MSPLTTHNLFHTIEGIAALSTFVLAAATILLAIAALVTARRTRALADETRGIATETRGIATETSALGAETRELANLQRLALQASVKPTLMPALGVEIVVSGKAVLLHVSNVGKGLALVQRARMVRRGGERPDEYGGTVSLSVVPPQERATAEFDFTTQEKRLAQFVVAPFWIEVDYNDAVGEQGETAIFHAEEFTKADKWRIVRVQLRRQDEDEPYASSGWGAIR